MQPETPTTSQSHIPYAMLGTDAERDLRSLDREMTARLSQTFGATLLILGLSMLIVLLMDLGRMSSRGMWGGPVPLAVLATMAVPILVCLVPGVVLLACVRPLRSGSRAAPIVVLILAIWIALGFTFALLRTVAGIVLVRPIPMDALLQALIFVTLLAATIKLVYHDIRLLVAPGRGPTREAIVGVTESLGAGREARPGAGLMRFGVLKLFSATLLTLSAGAVLAMTLLPAAQPAPVTPPPQATTAFTGDLIAETGLPAADRQIVIDHIASGGPLTHDERQQLDAALREFGRSLIDEAHWPVRKIAGAGSSPTGPATYPLTPQIVAQRLPFDHESMEKVRAELRQIPGGDRQAVIYAGGWVFHWAPAGMRVGIDHALWGAATSGHRFDGAFFRGDALRQRRDYSIREWQWTLASIERVLNDSSVSSRPTIAQVNAIRDRIRAHDPGEQNLEQNPPPPILRFKLALRDDGAMEINGPEGRMWLTPAGQFTQSSPEAQVQDAASVARPRMLKISRMPAGAVLACGIISASLAISLMMLARRFEQENSIEPRARAARNVLLAQVLMTLLTVAAIAWLAATLFESERSLRDWLWSGVVMVPALLAAVWMILAGVVVPLLLRRRLS